MLKKPIIEISGIDYSGKSTQASLLAMETWHLHVHNFGSFDKYDKNGPKNLTPQEHFNWWFVEQSPDDMANHLIANYENRIEAILANNEVDVAVVERGRTMLLAQIAANYAIRLSLDIEDVVDRAIDVVDQAKMVQLPSKEYVLVQNTSATHPKHRKFTRTFDAKQDSPYSAEQESYYADYLVLLKSSLGFITAQSTAHCIAIEPAAVDTQNTIRKHDDLSDYELPEIIPHKVTAIGLAGYSESGKSAVADRLSKDYGFTRVKLGYFNEAMRGAKSRYANPTQVALGALHFIATNRHIDKFTFESLHGPRLSSELKNLLGDRWKAVMLRTSHQARRDRLVSQYPEANIENLMSEQDFKDKVKQDAGIADYEEIADIIIDNNGSLDEAVKTLIGELYNERAN